MHNIRASLNALRAFEATARLRSFSGAAQELSVTHGAVSRHVKQLEDILGVPLLQRRASGALPTEQGQRLLETLSRAFALIQTGLEELRPGPVTLSCSESIMMYWLLPRLGRIEQALPSVELRYNTGAGPLNFVRDSVSVALRLSSIEPPKDAIVRDAAVEWIGPVCSPQYQRGARIRTVEDLRRARLIASRTRLNAWNDWWSFCGETGSAPPISESFAHFYLLIQAAKCGLGMANVPRMLVRDDLANGTLIAPLGFVTGPNRLQVWLAPHLARHGDAERLATWLANELGMSEGMDSP
jgi:DNA-binding transcriptional LysR family regulator